MFSRTSTCTIEKPPGRAKKRLTMLGVPLILGAGLAGLTTTATPAFASVLGGVSMQAACQTQYGSSYSAEVVNYNVYGWACESPNSNYYPYPINVNEECYDQYGYGAYGSYSNYNDPYSWYCQN